jgi:hypothetical protein
MNGRGQLKDLTMNQSPQLADREAWLKAKAEFERKHQST